MSLELHDVPIFRWESDTSGILSSILHGHVLNVREQHWRCKYFDAELAFVAGFFLLKVILDVRLFFFGSICL